MVCAVQNRDIFRVSVMLCVVYPVFSITFRKTKENTKKFKFTFAWKLATIILRKKLQKTKQQETEAGNRNKSRQQKQRQATAIKTFRRQP